MTMVFHVFENVPNVSSSMVATTSVIFVFKYDTVL